VEIVMGVVLVIIGFALFSGIYEKYAALLSQNVWIDFGI
jgi:hypothetical protein